jgi:ABC-type transport system involved in multi-copper enzyme maturation permease subunit
MFITLLAVTFLIALIVTFIVARVFQGSIGAILERIFGDKISTAWQRYVTFAIYVVGISGGVRIWDLEKYISPHGPGEPQLVLNRDRWVLEVYRTIIETLQSTAWLLLVFFLITLIAYSIVRLVAKAAPPQSSVPPAN